MHGESGGGDGEYGGRGGYTEERISGEMLEGWAEDTNMTSRVPCTSEGCPLPLRLWS